MRANWILTLLAVAVLTAAGLLLWPGRGQRPAEEPATLSPPGNPIRDFLPAPLPPPAAPPPEHAPPPPTPSHQPPGRLGARPAQLVLHTTAGAAGQPPATGRLLVTNDGGQPLALHGLALAGDTTALQLDSHCAGTLPPGGTCAADIAYRPAVAGRTTVEIIVMADSAEPLRLPVIASADPPPAASPGVAPAAAPAGAAQLRRARADQGGPAVLADHPPGPVVVTGSNYLVRRTDATAAHGGYGPDTPVRRSSQPVRRDRLLTADSYIPAVLESSINSQVGGRVTAVVERNVFARDGTAVLIPRGSRVIGDYEPLSQPGQTRLAVVWHRILRPDGAQIIIDDIAADALGRSGLIGEMDRRLWDRFGLATLISLIGAGANVGAAAAEGSRQVTSVGGAIVSQESGLDRSMRQGAADISQSLTHTVDQLLQESMHVAPVLVVPQGTRIVITPHHDLELALPAGTPPVDSIPTLGHLAPVAAPAPAPAGGGTAAGQPPRSGFATVTPLAPTAPPGAPPGAPRSAAQGPPAANPRGTR